MRMEYEIYILNKYMIAFLGFSLRNIFKPSINKKCIEYSLDRKSQTDFVQMLIRVFETADI